MGGIAPGKAKAAALNANIFSRSFFPSELPETPPPSSRLSNPDFLGLPGDPASPADPGIDPGGDREKFELVSRASLDNGFLFEAMVSASKPLAG